MADVSILKRRSALLPIMMSGVALAIVILHIAIAGPARQPDEGAEAHLWLLLMAGQIPVIAYFVVSSLPQRPVAVMPVLGLQAIAALAALAPVFLLRW